MRFDIKALAVSCAILWGGCVLVVAVTNAITAGYAQQFLDMLSSWYPGYRATHSVAQVAIVTLYAIVDGLIGGALFGWLYNSLSKSKA